MSSVGASAGPGPARMPGCRAGERVGRLTVLPAPPALALHGPLRARLAALSGTPSDPEGTGPVHVPNNWSKDICQEAGGASW